MEMTIIGAVAEADRVTEPVVLAPEAQVAAEAAVVQEVVALVLEVLED